MILTAALLAEGKESGNGAGIPWELHRLEQLEDRFIVLAGAPGGEEEELDFIGKPGDS